MTMPGPCRPGLTEHCEICTHAGAMICCECGNALPPFHPEIQALWLDGVVRWP